MQPDGDRNFRDGTNLNNNRVLTAYKKYDAMETDFEVWSVFFFYGKIFTTFKLNVEFHSPIRHQVTQSQ